MSLKYEPSSEPIHISQENGRAKVVGESTFGTGLVQTYPYLDNPYDPTVGDP